ncbi:MAG: TolC family protein [Prevotella sp.]
MRNPIMLLTLIMTLSAANASPESMDDILASIERNNTEMKALAKEAEAEKAANHSGLAMENPEIEFGYLWGSPSAIGSRKDFSASQPIDMATLTGSRRRAAQSKDVMAEWQYRTGRMDILLSAQQLCIDIIYYNAMIAALDRREKTASSIASAEKTKLEAGEAGRMTYNEAMLDLKILSAEKRRNIAERDALMARLVEMNGGVEITLADTTYKTPAATESFEAWYEEAARLSPALAYVRQDIDVSKRQLAVSRQEGMPKLSVGFSGEYVMGEKYQGVTVGMTIPLWGNKSRIRQAKAAVEAAEARHDNAISSFYGMLRAQYVRQQGLKATADMYAETLRTTDNLPLLKKALEAGQISMTEYMAGKKIYYEAENMYLEAMKEWHKAYAEMMAVTL